VVLPYADEKTPLDLTGKKMLPILVKEDNTAMNESLDIIEYLDKGGVLKWQREAMTQLEDDLNIVTSVAHNLTMPHWIFTKEFDQESRDYFIEKKSQKRGPFKDLHHKREEFLIEVDRLLMEFETIHIRPKQSIENHQVLSLKDILIASHLWGLFIVPEFQFNKSMYNYLMRVKKLSHFDYHEDFWRD
jgi:glutaredoxin 2